MPAAFQPAQLTLEEEIMSAVMHHEYQAAPALPGMRNESTGDDERVIVDRAKHGSTEALELLVDRYERRIFRLAHNVTGNYEDAEEAVQSAFVKAFRNLANFRGDSRFYTWLVRITVNEALMKVRGRRFREVPIDESDDVRDEAVPRQLKDWGPNPEERYSREELRAILETAVSQLSPGYRVVFQLRDVEGFTTEETAQLLALSISAVKTRVQRARLQLRNRLDVHFRAPARAAAPR
jgi:RNA polymerase sigma-70 factor, ECF subfamily